MWKRVCDTAERCIAEPKEYNKQRYDKTHKEPEFRVEDQELVANLNLNNGKGPKSNNAVEVRLTEEFSRKHPVFPVSLVKHDHQTGEDKFPSRKKIHTPQDIAEVEDSLGPVKKIPKARKIILNGKSHRQYFVGFKNQTADEDEWLAKDDIPDGNLYLRRGLKSLINDEPFLEGGYVSL
ncbi:hypothetical protein O181_102933 [Austropuccinia psidii MF-1]|uniref:Chromo domain-containing protein n=1 Tax=Austropuccinia psidii MF-1 TaxID=1389203 RepID=A0A9Q3JJD7_9BASI|nr:hypothetical protein [Austropuccinia psidii MF-1]